MLLGQIKTGKNNIYNLDSCKAEYHKKMHIIYDIIYDFMDKNLISLEQSGLNNWIKQSSVDRTWIYQFLSIKYNVFTLIDKAIKAKGRVARHLENIWPFGKVLHDKLIYKLHRKVLKIKGLCLLRSFFKDEKQNKFE